MAYAPSQLLLGMAQKRERLLLPPSLQSYVFSVVSYNTKILLKTSSVAEV
jgi:hypothetical protein